MAKLCDHLTHDYLAQRKITIVATFILAALLCSATIALAASATQDTNTTVTLEDFSGIVTRLDNGFDDFSGNMGAIKAG